MIPADGSEIDVQVGQVWRDLDPRIENRTVTVDVIHAKAGYAFCTSSRGARVRIRLDRFKKNAHGYELVKASS